MNHNLGFSKQELAVLKKLSTPIKIQDFLQTLRMNFNDAYRSPRFVLKTHSAHCFEGALFAAACFWLQGEAPLLMDLKSGHGDDDHVVAVFKRRERWGAISKTNHHVLRYRDPVYANMRELAMSYFHEYTLDDGTKYLKSYSKPLDLRKFAKRNWTTDKHNLFYLVKALDKMKHIKIVPAGIKLRRADAIELKVGDIVEWEQEQAIE